MQITNQHKEADGTISCITVAPELEKRLEDALQQTDEGPYIVLDPGSQERLIANLAELIKKAATIKYEVLLLCSSSIRLGLRRMLERHFPQLFVLSYNEIASDVQIKSVGVLRV
jgi:flagellar biosynthesis protein FlhA